MSTNTTQIEAGLHYRVIRNADASLKLDRSKEVHIGAIVKALEYAPFGALDVIDVEIEGYDEPTVFAYQLNDTPKNRTLNSILFLCNFLTHNHK